MALFMQSFYWPMRTPCLPGSSCSSTYSDGVENPAELMELSFGESGCNIAKMSYSIPGVFHSALSVLLLTQTLFPDGGMCRLLVGAGRVTAACLSQAQASTQLLGHLPSGTQTQMPAMLNLPGALSVADRSRKNSQRIRGNQPISYQPSRGWGKTEGLVEK
ncbi:hypothetical protein KOW79_019568 [Hemibagrus wyckioides]|uniref:Uncharacterized protein n=1 Tax=Hemibagrus wyckioides TaxID=337641 RepID=A0A9D3SBA4_9TELE|nr:hypothetical protein KOW79_019568 [Hemibagrus wyckioides]